MADFLEDDESCPMNEHRFGHQEWDRLEETFINAGYREGITAGKEEALQEGFDGGFAEHGAPIGREIGLLRGTAAGLLIYLQSPSSMTPSGATPADEDTRQRQRRDAQAIVTGLAALPLVDLLPPDAEALEHAKEHAESDGRDGASKSATTEGEEAKAKWEAAKSGMEGLKSRLNALLGEVGLEIRV
ncbi:hypothetical protein DL93DRAFT_2151020 [Clavulina sp. PMI_390]|nr:hypothetical protein DL93DRAFT_2151020 [Clavulina sp. PMI_390]